MHASLIAVEGKEACQRACETSRLCLSSVFNQLATTCELYSSIPRLFESKPDVHKFRYLTCYSKAVTRTISPRVQARCAF